ncbi:polysaccharide deacetylase family protein [Methylosinus sporium]|uniref:Chitooligosaccharide deacetylase n=1 Tax=Methylosinus sporium TaxID=428 RepID=A0A2U1SNL7_METSR|nr:polysaccharide deacetylase family protein [Methylosinus sporium]PWB93195.1 polysaccharide deacetylase [Methylosinus sporium]
MTKWRRFAIEAGMEFFRASGAHRLAEPFTRGLGAILMFHRVRPRLEQAFEPNQPLEITPEFLNALILWLRQRGVAIVSLETALTRLRDGASAAPFAVLTFDDGYRDFVEHALPVLERHGAPFTLYITAGYADASARLWWVELEEAVRRLDRVDVVAGGKRVSRAAATAEEKRAAFAEIYAQLRAGDEAELLRVVTALSAEARLEPLALTRRLCLGWSELRALSRHELATVGAHSVTHARLAKVDCAAAIYEMTESRLRIESELERPVRHFCYPVGDPTSAGRREFELAALLGFASAATTRPGMIFPAHCDHLLALPRLSVNGRHQSLAALDILLSGAPFALMNAGRRVMAA